MVAGGVSGGGGDPPESAGATYGGSDLRLRLRLRVSGTGDISCLIVFSASPNVDIHTT